MKRILIVTHSELANGFIKTLSLLIGDAETENITTISAFVDDSDYTEEVDKFFENYSNEDQYIVFTDLYGGSINQKLTGYKANYEFYLITGTNLPVLLEVILQPDHLTQMQLLEIIESSRQELKLVELESSVDESDDDNLDDFLGDE